MNWLKKTFLLLSAVFLLCLFVSCSLEDRDSLSSITLDGRYLSGEMKRAYPFSVTYSPLSFIEGDNTFFSPEVANLLMVLSGDAYSGVTVTLEDQNATLYSGFHLDDREDFTLSASQFDYDKDDLTGGVFAHQTYRYNQEDYDLVFVILRGTSGSREWCSNFDVGSDGIEYGEMTGEHPEWSDKRLHKGFSVAASRVDALLSSYLERHAKGDKTILVFSGHSRGGAIANLLGKEYETKPGFKTFTYTFACPMVTTVEDWSASTIFNLNNQDDLVPFLPLAEWGFHRYGTDMTLVMENADRTLWEEYVGSSYKKTGAAETDFFASFCLDRSKLYVIGGGEDQHYATSSVKESEMRSNRLWSYGEFSTEEGVVSGQICPAFFLHFAGILAGKATGAILLDSYAFLNKYRSGFAQDSPYDKTIDSLSSAVSGILPGHSTFSYFLLVEDLK